MRKAVLVFVVFVLCFIVYASEASLETKEMVNGRYWNALATTQKSIYLQGVLDFAVFVSRDFELRCKDSDTGKEIIVDKKSTGCIGSLRPEATYEAVIAYIDKFYSDKKNLNIPIMAAYVFMVNDYRGTMAQEDVKKVRDIYK